MTSTLMSHVVVMVANCCVQISQLRQRTSEGESTEYSHDSRIAHKHNIPIHRCCAFYKRLNNAAKHAIRSNFERLSALNS